MRNQAYSALALRDSALLRFLERLVASFKAHAILFVIPLLFLLTNLYWMRDLVEPQRSTYSALILSMFEISIPAALFTLFFVKMARYAFVIKPPSPSRALIEDCRAFLSNPAIFLNAVPLLAAMVVFNKAMLDLKPSISAIAPFSWDTWLAESDRLIHLGHDPWVLLQPVLGYPIVSSAISLVYCFWFLAMFTFWFWFAFEGRYTDLRLRFFLAYMLAWWLGGGLMALYFSSAGPVYYGRIGLTPDVFAPLMTYLHGVKQALPMWALDTQEFLWRSYTVRDEPFLGISAFPSMHVATAALIALSSFHLNKRLGYWMCLFCAVILIGSVHLGWHYALDGYAGIVIAVAAWWVAEKIVAFNARLPWVKAYRAELES